MLKQVNSQAIHVVFETFRSILQSGKLTSRVQYMIEVLFAVRKDNFKVRREGVFLGGWIGGRHGERVEGKGLMSHASHLSMFT